MGGVGVTLLLRARGRISASVARGPVRAVLAALTLALGLAAGPAVSVAAAAATAPPPPNDNYLLSTVIPQSETTGVKHTTYRNVIPDTSGATTQSQLFNPDQSGLPFGGGGPEPVTCNGTTYGETVWYDVRPRVPGGVEIQASGYTTAIAFFQYNVNNSMLIRSSDLCQTSGSSTLNDFAVPEELQAHKRYTFQVGGLATGPGEFDSGRLSLQVTFFPDHDGDGVLDEQPDHCPFLPGVLRFGGCPPTINPIPRFDFIPGSTGTRLSFLRVDQIPGGSRVEARCRVCGVGQVRHASLHGNSVLMTGFAGTHFPLGSKLEIWVTKSATGKVGDQFRFGAIGSYISYTVGTGGLGHRVIRCLMPGSMTPRRQCPPGGRR